MSKSKTSGKADKPKKPYPDFPLFPHANGLWAKKIRGRFVFFGPWRDPDAALQRYLDQRDDLHAGRTPRKHSDGLTVRELLNRFLAAKEHQLGTGEITARTFEDYHTTCKRLADVFGVTRLVDDLASDDFEKLRAFISQTRGPTSLGNEVQRVRVVFNYAYQAGLIDKPMRYGPTFKRPSRKVLRRLRVANGPRMFERHELQSMLEQAPLQLRGMLLLGINCGFGNYDCGTLPIKALDLKRGWVNFPRPKTGIERRSPLWPETIEALECVIANRGKPKDEVDAGLVFLTKYGQRWSPETRSNPISAECKKLLKKLKIYRRGLGFYALRHTVETIGGDSRDQVAVDHIMGHARDDMASVYRERISDERLRTVVDYVHKWLFGE